MAKSQIEMKVEVKSCWILIVAMNLLLFHIAAQSPQGFVSIDCGGTGGMDPNTNLYWKSDAGYLDGAAVLNKEGVTMNATVTLADSPSPVDNAERLKTALIFYPGFSNRIPRSKYCYVLPVEYNASGDSRNYLLRATFPSRNLTAAAKEHEPISLSAYNTRFYFTVDSTFVSTVELDNFRSQTIELIITPIDIKMYVCLVPLEDRSSMPAISALELRPFAYGMYARNFDVMANGEVKGRQKSYLWTIIRWSFGGDPDLPSIRYPTDRYDRRWSSPRIPSSQSLNIQSVQNVTAFDLTFDIRANDIDPPEAVIGTAWEAESLQGNVSFTIHLSAPGAAQPTNFWYNFMWSDVFDTSNRTRIIDLFYDQGNGMEDGFDDVEMDHRDSIQISSKLRTSKGDSVTFEMRANGRSMLPALVNAVEVYSEFNAVRTRTLDDEAEAVQNFASKFPDQLDAAGDPCLPIPWAWLVCSIERPSRVSQINLASKGVGGNLPLEFGRLKGLTVLNLSNNNFSGNLPGSLGGITALRVLILSNNNISGELPPFSPRSLQNLETLSLSRNRFTGNLSSIVGALDDIISDLDLSSNQFSGPLPLEIENLTNLLNLDLSNNQLSGELTLDLVKLGRLQTLNLNDNRLEGTVPDSIWSLNSSLESVNLNGNNFTQLNLTTWYISIVDAKSFHAYPGRQKVWLVGNQIQNIIAPSLEDLERILSQSKEDKQKRSLAFILLAGNPWCKLHEGNSTLITRYFCRSHENEDYWSSPSKDQGVSTKALINGLVIGGLVIFIIICLLVFSLWRIHTFNLELHQIQEALAKEHVKPPFFHYNDLKTATAGFSTSSILGKGGFGTVYKAELPDGSVLAVKRLNRTEQNTSDFFKEIVNITGIKHRHLIQLKGCCVRERQERMLVYEYAENKNLAQALWGPGKPFVLSWQQRFDICLGVARGLAYLHEELQPRMIHRDIKPQNILLDKDYNAKIADFGLVRPATTDNTEITFNIGGTRGYCSPEYFNEGVVSEKLDVYSFGIVVMEIVSGRVCINYNLPEDRKFLRAWALELYDKGTVLDLVDNELTGEYDEREVLLVLRTALACCQLDSKNRPTMSQVVNTFMKHADVAIDIVRELRPQRLNLESVLEDDTGGLSPSEVERHGLICFGSEDGAPLTELIGR